MSAPSDRENAPLLSTKLYVPRPRVESVPRPHLVARMEEAMQCGYQLILVSAPAGFGKTTLVSEWVHGSAGHVAWLSLDGGDNDPSRFWTYAITALREVLPGLGDDALAMLRAADLAPGSDRLPAEVVLSGLINEIARRIRQDLPERSHCMLVLDDYHLIEDRAIHDMVAFFLAHMPPGFHLAIVTRSDPPLPLSRLRGRGQLVELRQADLCFTKQEVGTFLRRATGEHISERQIAAWAERTEGWIAGLQMAALAMRTAGRTQEREGALSGERYILDYLVEEVLSHQPARIRSFLLQTSILGRLTASLCSAVIEIEDEQATGAIEQHSQEILEYLERENLFVVALDDRRAWYRYHLLFADLLQHRLRQSTPDLVPILHGRASAWYERRAALADAAAVRGELMAAAIDHALAARDLDLAAYLIETELSDALWERGELATMAGWLAQLPKAAIEAQPKLGAYQALLSLIEGQADLAQRWVEVVERHLDREEGFPSIEASISAAPRRGRATEPAAGRDQVELMCLVATIRASLGFLQGEAETAIRYARWALDNLPETSKLWRCILTMILGDTTAWSGDLHETRRLYEQALAMSAATASAYLVFRLRVRIASILWFSGQLRQVDVWCSQTVALCKAESVLQHGVAPKLFAIWSDAQRERNDLARALEYARRAYEMSHASQNVGGMVLAHVCLVRVLLAQGDLAAARQIESELETLAIESRWPSWFSQAMANAMLAARVLAGVADASALDKATWAQFTRAGDKEVFPLYLHLLIRLALVKLYVYEGQYGEADELLDHSLAYVASRGQMASQVALLALRALVRQGQGREAAAQRELARALAMAEPEGFVRTFVDLGAPMARLLYQAAAEGVAPTYTGRLLAAFELEEPAETMAAAPALVEPLTDREIEVLALVAEGLTNREVAQRLVVSVSTIKVHTYNIYNKLDVHNRTQAVAKARALGIL